MVWGNLFGKGIGDFEFNVLYQVKLNNLGNRYI